MKIQLILNGMPDHRFRLPLIAHVQRTLGTALRCAADRIAQVRIEIINQPRQATCRIFATLADGSTAVAEKAVQLTRDGGKAWREAFDPALRDLRAVLAHARDQACRVATDAATIEVVETDRQLPRAS
jgi:hypothetical protein